MKRLLTICLLVCILMSGVSALAAANGDLMRVVNCNEWVSLRQMPSTKAARMDKVPKNALVVYLGEAQSGFAYVQYDGQGGYVLKRYLSDQSDALQVGNCEQWVSLRSYPSTKATRLVKIPKGAVVRFLAPAYDGFFWVEYNGRTGYVASEYLMGTTSANGRTRQVTKCNEWISLRSEASTKAARLAKIPLNATVSSLFTTGNMEYVCYNGQYGYVLSEYLKDTFVFSW